MKIIIFGATGNTGLCCLRSAVRLGFQTTAFVRDSSKLPDELRSNVELIVGDATNAYDVENALEGQEGVVIALGTRNDLSPTTSLSDGTKTILSAMVNHNILRVSVCISAFLFWERSKLPARFHDLTDDHERMLEALKNSDREWIAVLPPHIADTPATGCPLISHDKAGETRVISKHDLGDFLVECLTSEEHVRKVCGICNMAEEAVNDYGDSCTQK